MPYSGKTFKGTSSGEIVEGTFQRESLGDGELLVRISHSGLCGTDLHALPTGCALGHEGVGYVEEVGPSCKTDLKVGERVGWGYIHYTCGKCRQCLTGKEEYCPNKHQFFTHDHDQGSLGEIAVRKEDWLFRIPDGLSNENAAPLMCGGATVFTPLIEYVKPTDRIGIVGIGGLGHLSIQFASKMGCDIVVFSGTEAKREEAMAMGATEFYATKGVADFNTLGLAKPLDKLIVTTATLPDWDNYFTLLSVNCTIIPLTIALGAKMSFPYSDLTLRGYTVVGTILAGRSMHEDMLSFAARNQVAPIIEKFPLTKGGVVEAVERLQSGKMRYRGVLTNEQ
ncbi:GroES-like protein [Hymenopellis radicata]|nr:GroES-like protein [Hymenopellis radicata]